MQVIVAVEWGMLALGCSALVTSSVFLGMVLVGAARFGARRSGRRTALKTGPEFLPAVSAVQAAAWRRRPGWKRNLRTFFEQDYLEHVAEAGLELRWMAFRG